MEADGRRGSHGRAPDATGTGAGARDRRGSALIPVPLWQACMSRWMAPLARLRRSGPKVDIPSAPAAPGRGCALH
jgi:hypothetical protein